MTDDLTGLHNLRSFEAHLAGMVRASRESRAPLAMLVADVDRLKAMNDAHGHLAGAEAVSAGWSCDCGTSTSRRRGVQVWWRRVRHRRCQLRIQGVPDLLLKTFAGAVQRLRAGARWRAFSRGIACHHASDSRASAIGRDRLPWRPDEFRLGESLFAGRR